MQDTKPTSGSGLARINDSLAALNESLDKLADRIGPALAPAKAVEKTVAVTVDKDSPSVPLSPLLFELGHIDNRINGEIVRINALIDRCEL